jgi:hypothetical protein
MSLPKLALVAVLAALLVPMANAQTNPPPGQGTAPGLTVTITLGALAGTVQDDKMAVIPYAGNATVPFTVSIGCNLVLYETVTNNADADHFHVLVDNPPAWLKAEEFRVDISPTDCGGGNTDATLVKTGNYPFAVAPGAPAIVTQTLNVTAEFAGNDATPAPLSFSVQFHPDYDVVPSVKFPYTVTNGMANFTVTVTNRANARSMVMFEELHASTGSVSGLGSVVYTPPETKTFNVVFKAPDSCWTNATVDFKTFSHYLLLDQRAGSYKLQHDTAWGFTNGVACKAGSSGTKASPLGGWVLIASVLGAAMLARRRTR